MGRFSFPIGFYDNFNFLPRPHITNLLIVTYNNLSEVFFMGLTSSSTGNLLISNSSNKLSENNADYIIGLAGNPNVRKIYYF